MLINHHDQLSTAGATLHQQTSSESGDFYPDAAHDDDDSNNGDGDKFIGVNNIDQIFPIAVLRKSFLMLGLL